MAQSTKTRDAYLRRVYGITLGQYNGLLKKQKDSCAVCGKHKTSVKGNLHVDHDHTTGEVRGLLCPWCNHRIVGRHRMPDLLLAAGKYLAGPFTGWIVPPKPKRRKKKRK